MARYVAMLRLVLVTTIITAITSACDVDLRKALQEVLDQREAEGESPSIDIEQALNTGRNYRAVHLDNKLVALLIHDPKAKKSAAALSVNVGSLENPAEHQGLAHFLEHMMFMGTSKYPEVGEYEKYITSYQGYDNAFTADEETCYYFEVNHEGFPGSLDRFAQMFVAPLFPPEYIERELNAVHSEHQKNLQNDLWRAYRISGLTSKNGHPRQLFGTGDGETLKNANREVVAAFHSKYYSANVMRLATISSLALDEQEQHIRNLFSAINNNDRDRLTYSADIYDANLLPQRVEVEPVADKRYVNLSFAVPSGHQYWQSKPDRLLSALLGDEGEGSLLSWLKQEGYATALTSGVYSSSYVGDLEVEITLTEKGLAEVNKVVELFFSYVTMLKKEGLQQYFYHESKQLGEIDYVYQDPREGADAVIYYARLMQRFAPLDALYSDSLFFKYAPLDFRLFLNHITPRQLKMMVVAKGAKTDKVEQYYGINYGVSTVPASVYRTWESPSTLTQLHYPPPNQFIPSDLKILADEPRDKPDKLLDTDQGVFWFQQDTEFLRPRAQLYLNILTDKTNSDIEQALLSELYIRALRESINEWKYPVLTAGLDFSINRNDRGISIDISGYSDKLPLLIGEIGKRLRQITIDDVVFAALKNELQRELANKVYDHGYLQVIHKGNAILNLNRIEPSAYADRIDAVALAAVRTYAEELFKEVAFEGVAYGNLSSTVLSQSLNDFMAQLEATTLPLERRKHEQILKLTQKYNYGFVTESNNHALIKLVQMGERSPTLDAHLRVIDTHVGSAFFTEVRSKQQLGYVVHAGLYYLKKVLGLRFIVQSSTHDPQQINERIAAFITMMTTQFAALSDEQLESYKQGIINEMQQPEQTIAERHDRLESEAIKLDGDFDYRQKLITALRELSKDDIITTWNTLASAGQLTVSLFAKGTSPTSLPNTTRISDIAVFKRSQTVYE